MSAKPLPKKTELPDALAVVPEPDILRQRQRWTTLTLRVPSLRPYRAKGSLAVPPPDSAPFRVRLLWELCCDETRDLFKVIASGEIDDVGDILW